MSHPLPLEGHRYLLTGASRGLGALTARALVELGAHVIGVARSAEALEELSSGLNSGLNSEGEGREGRLSTEIIDLTKLSELSAWAEGLEGRYGPLTGVIHNAGVDDFQPSEAMSAGAIEAQVALNLTAPLLINRALLPAMLARNEGVLLHLSSVAGYFPTPFGAVYSGTKAGLWLYSEALAIEHAHTNLAFVTLHPSFVHGVGMHERHKEKAGGAPLVLGGTTAEAVVKAITRALLKKERLKSGAIIVNQTPLRPFILLFHALPRLTRWLFSKLVRPYLERVAR